MLFLYPLKFHIIQTYKEFLFRTQTASFHIGTYRFKACFPATATPAKAPPTAPATAADLTPLAARYSAPVPSPAATLFHTSSASLAASIPLSIPAQSNPSIPTRFPQTRPECPAAFRTRLIRSFAVSPDSKALTPSTRPAPAPPRAPARQPQPVQKVRFSPQEQRLRRASSTKRYSGEVGRWQRFRIGASRSLQGLQARVRVFGSEFGWELDMGREGFADARVRVQGIQKPCGSILKPKTKTKLGSVKEAMRLDSVRLE